MSPRSLPSHSTSNSPFAYSTTSPFKHHQQQSLLVGRFLYEATVGNGSFGVVGKYVDVLSKRPVAIKSITYSVATREARRLRRELDLMMFLRDAHPSVISSYMVFATPEREEVLVSPIINGSSTTSYSQSSPLLMSSVHQLTAGSPRTPHHNILSALHAVIANRDGRWPSLMDQHREFIRLLADLSRAAEEAQQFSIHIVMPYIHGSLMQFSKLVADCYRHLQHSSLIKLPPEQQASVFSPQYLASASVVLAFRTASGLDFLHRCRIVHRDIKPENVLVNLDATNPMAAQAIVADLGLAREVENLCGTAYVCTRCYRPPEVITQASLATEASDVWSLGCVLYELCTCLTLFPVGTSVNRFGQWDGGMASQQLETVLNIVGRPSEADILKYQSDGSVKSYLLRCHSRPSQLTELILQHWKLTAATPLERDLWIALIHSCLAFFPAQRPTAKEVCHHPLFSSLRLHYVEPVFNRDYIPTPCSAQLTPKAAIFSVLMKSLDVGMDSEPDTATTSSSRDGGTSTASSAASLVLGSGEAGDNNEDEVVVDLKDDDDDDDELEVEDDVVPSTVSFSFGYTEEREKEAEEREADAGHEDEEDIVVLDEEEDDDDDDDVPDFTVAYEDEEYEEVAAADDGEGRNSEVVEAAESRHHDPVVMALTDDASTAEADADAATSSLSSSSLPPFPILRSNVLRDCYHSYLARFGSAIAARDAVINDMVVYSSDSVASQDLRELLSYFVIISGA